MRDTTRAARAPRDIITAYLAVERAEQHGIRFSIEGGKLAVSYPPDIAPGLWRELQQCIWTNRQLIADYVHSRELGIVP